MNTFAYKYPVTVYLGEHAAANNLPAELQKVHVPVLAHTIACRKSFPLARSEF